MCPCKTDASTRRKRTKAGGSRKRKYTEGWVEFEDKKVAKMVALDVNGTLIGKLVLTVCSRVHQCMSFAFISAAHGTHAGIASDMNIFIAGGKKRNFYHDDMWNIKYLKGFKWRHLTEKLGTSALENTSFPSLSESVTSVCTAQSSTRVFVN